MLYKRSKGSNLAFSEIIYKGSTVDFVKSMYKRSNVVFCKTIYKGRSVDYCKSMYKRSNMQGDSHGLQHIQRDNHMYSFHWKVCKVFDFQFCFLIRFIACNLKLLPYHRFGTMYID